MRLHEITEAMIELQNIADNDELDDEVLRDTFEGLDGAFESLKKGGRPLQGSELCALSADPTAA